MLRQRQAKHQDCGAMLGRKEAQCRRLIFSFPTSRNEHSGQIGAPKWQNTGGDERQKEAPQRGSSENRPFAKRAKRHRQPVSMPHQRLAKCSFLTRECPFFAPKMPRKHRFLPAGRNRKKPRTRHKRHLHQPLHIWLLAYYKRFRKIERPTVSWVSRVSQVCFSVRLLYIYYSKSN